MQWRSPSGDCVNPCLDGRLSLRTAHPGYNDAVSYDLSAGAALSDVGVASSWRPGVLRAADVPAGAIRRVLRTH